MRIVIDTNRIIASLIKDGTSRKILFSEDIEFITPDFSLQEIEKYKGYIIGKASISMKKLNC